MTPAGAPRADGAARRSAAAVALLLSAATGCAAPASAPRYVVGAPYPLGGEWHYPREDFALVETGLAVVAPDARPGRVTANGERHDPGRPSAAHRTLQLPAALRVTNLENGRALLLRVNDRGPAHPGRVVELSRRAAELLGIPPGGTARVRIAVAPEESRALAAALRAAGGADPADDPAPILVAAAPRATVATEALPPLPGARAAATDAARPAAMPAQAAAPLHSTPSPPTFPERVEQEAPAPGRLLVEAGTFSRHDAAARQTLRLTGLGARLAPVGEGRQQQFRIRIGPLATVAEADRVLERVRASGVSGARILVDDAVR
jgi:rare lipoprotein A